MSLKFAHLTDIHCPIQHKNALRWALDQIEREKPGLVVIGGDAYEGEPWSRHPSENSWTLPDEYEAWAKVARDINEVAPQARKVWIYGNHEDNWRQVDRIPKRLRPIVDWRDWDPLDRISLRDQVADWRVITRYGSRVRWWCGPVCFVHGTKAGLYAARDMALEHGRDNTLVLSGHTHRPVPITRHAYPGGVPSNLWYGNSGCLADWEKMTYIQRLNHQSWGHAITIGEIYSTNKTLLMEGRKAYANKIWDAEVRVLTLARDTM